MQNTENLISTLQSDLSPSKKLWPVSLQFLIWSILTFSATFLSFITFKLGAYPETITDSTAISFEVLAGLSLIFLSVISALVLSRPDRGKLAKFLPVTTIVLWGVGIIWAVMTGPDFAELGSVLSYFKSSCFRKILLLSILPSVILLYLVSRGASTKIFWASAWSGFAGATVGYLAIRLECYYIEPFHILLSHVLPALIFVIASAFIGRKILTW